MARSQKRKAAPLAVESGAGANGKVGGPPASFYVVVFDNDAQTAIKKRLKEHHDFTDAFVTGLNVSSTQTSLCLISLDGKTIDHASLMKLSRAVSTGKSLLKFFGVRAFPSIALTAIEVRVPSAGDSYSTSSAATLKTVTSEMEQAVLSVIRTSSDRAKHVISELETLRRFLQQKFDESQFRIIAQEKDALILLAEIWGLEREELPEWTWAPSPDSSPPSSYVDEITKSHECHLVTKDIARMKRAFSMDGKSTTCAEDSSWSTRIGRRPSSLLTWEPKAKSAAWASTSSFLTSDIAPTR
jgi:hypothetical protein